MDEDRERGAEPKRFGEREPEPAAAGAAYMGLGLQFGAAIILFMFVGMWLDRRLGTSPWLLILGVFTGAAGGFYSIYRRLMEDQKREDARRAARKGGT
jgi:F0F1-type ATP synthase assembly protein I